MSGQRAMTIVLGATLGIACAAEASAQQRMQAASVASRSDTARASELTREIRRLVDLLETEESAEISRALNRATIELERLRCTTMLDTAGWVDSGAEAACIWGNGRTIGLGLANLTAHTDGGSLYADLLTTTFGRVRAALGTTISQVDSDSAGGGQTEDSALQRLIAGGGNLVLAAQLPVRVDLSTSRRASWLMSIGARAAFDIPALGATTGDVTRSGGLSLDAQGRIASDDEALELFGQLTGEVLVGSADFYRATGLATRCCPKYTQFSVGATIRRAVVVTYTRVFAGTDRLKDFGGQISVTARRQ